MPFKSKSQHRACRAAKDPNWDCHEWAAATKSMKKLPERIHEEGPKMATGAKDKLKAMIAKKAEEKILLKTNEAASRLLDHLAAGMPFQKTAGIRTVQAALSSGQSIQRAIKCAYPNMKKDAQEKLIETITKLSAEKLAELKSTGPKSWRGPTSGGMSAMGKMMGR